MKITSIESSYDFNQEYIIKEEMINAFHQSQLSFTNRHIKVTPTNSEYTQTLNMGYVNINESRTVFSCFIGSCRFKSHTFEHFHRHLNCFHYNDEEILKHFCLICERFECGLSLDAELQHLVDHMHQISFEHLETVKQEAAVDIIEEISMEIEENEKEISQLLGEIEGKFNEIKNYQELIIKSEKIDGNIAENQDKVFEFEGIQQNIEPNLDETPNLLIPIQTPFKAPKPVEKQPLRSRSKSLFVEPKTTARKRTYTIDARRQTINEAVENTQMIKIKQEPISLDETMRIDNESPEKSSQSSEESPEKIMTEKAFKIPQNSTKTLKDVAQKSSKSVLNSSFSSNFVDVFDNDEELNCLSFIGKKIQEAKTNNDDKIENFEARKSVEDDLNESSCLTFIGKKIQNAKRNSLDDTIRLNDESPKKSTQILKVDKKASQNLNSSNLSTQNPSPSINPRSNITENEENCFSFIGKKIQETKNNNYDKLKNSKPNSAVPMVSRDLEESNCLSFIGQKIQNAKKISLDDTVRVNNEKSTTSAKTSRNLRPSFAQNELDCLSFIGRKIQEAKNHNLDDTVRVNNENPSKSAQNPISSNNLQNSHLKASSNLNTRPLTTDSELSCLSFIGRKIQNSKHNNLDDTVRINNKSPRKSTENHQNGSFKSPKGNQTPNASNLVQEVSNSAQKSTTGTQKSSTNISSSSSIRNSTPEIFSNKRKSPDCAEMPPPATKVRKILKTGNKLTVKAVAAIRSDNKMANSIDRYFKKLDQPETADLDETIDLSDGYEGFKPEILSCQGSVTEKTAKDDEIDLSGGFKGGRSTQAMPTQKSTEKTAKNSKLSQLEQIQFENLKDLYPWVDEEVTRTAFKSKTSINVLLSEFCMFSTYKCMHEACIFFTTDFEEFKEHTSTTHTGVNRHFCSFCLSSFQKPTELINHISHTHSFDRFQCNKCMYRSIQKVYVYEHQKKFHPAEICEILKSPVQKLPKAAKDNAERMMVRNREQFVKPYHCKTPRCPEVFYNKQNFIKHLESDLKKPINAEFLSIIKEQMNEIDHSKTTQNVEGNVQCLFCKFGTDREDILTHMALNHKSQFAFVCKRVDPGYVIARDSLLTHTKIEFIGAHFAEVKNFDGELDNLKSMKLAKDIKLEPRSLIPENMCNDVIVID